MHLKIYHDVVRCLQCQARSNSCASHSQYKLSTLIHLQRDYNYCSVLLNSSTHNSKPNEADDKLDQF